ELNVRQYPELRNAVVNVTTVYYGADADLIQGFITTPLEREIASAEGIDYMSSTSSAGVSTIQAYIRLDHDPNEALTQIAAKVNKMRGQLPPESEDPVIDLQQGQQIAAMYVSFASETLDNNQITDYLTRVVQPKLVTVPGVQRADILGAGTFAMGVWLETERMAALQVTASDASCALWADNVLSAVGSTKGQMVAIDMTARTDLQSPEEFRQLVIREEGGAIVRLGDVADVVLGSENYGTSVRINGESATFMGIFVSPDANSLDVIADVRALWDNEIRSDMTARTDLQSPEEFRQLVIREEGGAIVRLGDVADVVLGSENYGTSVRINGESATFMGIFVSPDANSLDVIADVRALWDNEI